MYQNYSEGEKVAPDTVINIKISKGAEPEQPEEPVTPPTDNPDQPTTDNPADAGEIE